MTAKAGRRPAQENWAGAWQVADLPRIGMAEPSRREPSCCTFTFTDTKRVKAHHDPSRPGRPCHLPCPLVIYFQQPLSRVKFVRLKTFDYAIADLFEVFRRQRNHRWS